MYIVKYGADTLHSPPLANLGYYVVNPVITDALNNVSKMTFTVMPDHPLYNSITPMAGEITAFNDLERVFCGRIITVDRAFTGAKSVVCEGDMAYLTDSIVRPYTFSGSVDEFFERLIVLHNAQSSHVFYKGNCTVTGTVVVEEESGYSTTLAEMQTRLLKVFGGYLLIRQRQIDGYSYGPTYIDYLKEPPVANQDITFGVNLLDLEDLSSGEDFFTRVIPVGKDGLTIESVNDGSDALADDAAAQKYGWITHVAEYPEVEDASTLKTLGVQALRDAAQTVQTITVKAMDLQMIDYIKYQSLKVGWAYNVRSPMHGLDGNTAYPLVSRTLDLTHPDKSTYTLGIAQRDLTRRL